MVSDILNAYQAQPHFSEVEISIQPSSTNFPAQIPLTIVVLKDSVWTSEEVEARIRRTEEIYAQCELSFNPIYVVWAKYDLGNVWDADNYKDILDFELLTASPAPKPILFLIDAEKNRSYGAGFSAGTHLYSLKEPLVNTGVLVGELALEDNKSAPWTKYPTRNEYEVMAHELAHILFMESHRSDHDNILSDNAYRNNTMDEIQCFKARERFKAK